MVDDGALYVLGKEMRSMHIRPVTIADDPEAVGAIYAASWQTAYRGLVPQDYLDTLSGKIWVPILTDPQYDSLVLLDGESYAGTAAVCPARDTCLYGYGELVSLYLLPDYWGTGGGTELLAAALTHLRQRGYSAIYLWVLEENGRARRFYEKHGWRDSGERTAVSVGGKALSECRYVYSVPEERV